MEELYIAAQQLVNDKTQDFRRLFKVNSSLKAKAADNDLEYLRKAINLIDSHMQTISETQNRLNHMLSKIEDTYSYPEISTEKHKKSVEDDFLRQLSDEELTHRFQKVRSCTFFAKLQQLRAKQKQEKNTDFQDENFQINIKDSLEQSEIALLNPREFNNIYLHVDNHFIFSDLSFNKSYLKNDLINFFKQISELESSSSVVQYYKRINNPNLQKLIKSELADIAISYEEEKMMLKLAHLDLKTLTVLFESLENLSLSELDNNSQSNYKKHLSLSQAAFSKEKNHSLNSLKALNYIIKDFHSAHKAFARTHKYADLNNESEELLFSLIANFQQDLKDFHDAGKLNKLAFRKIKDNLLIIINNYDKVQALELANINEKSMRIGDIKHALSLKQNPSIKLSRQNLNKHLNSLLFKENLEEI